MGSALFFNPAVIDLLAAAIQEGRHVFEQL
jgi:hypothetical protein